MNALEWLAKLVTFNTVSDRSNLEMLRFLATHLQGLGYAVHSVPNAAGDKAALFASLGTGGLDGGVCYSAHMDVVPTAGQAWDTDPFTLSVKGTRLYGRGSTDMKGFIACCMARAKELADTPVQQPVHFCFSYDEEIGCLGVVPTITKLGRDLPRPACVIVGEPTLMHVATAHKSIASFDTTLVGRGAHSSNPTLGIHTIEAARFVLNELAHMRNELAQQHDDAFKPNHSTLHVGTMRAGQAVNIVPDRCEIGWEIRGLPTQNVHGFGDALQSRLLDNSDFVAIGARATTLLDNIVPAFASSASPELLRHMLRIAGHSAAISVAYGTEAGHFEAAGIPTLICGPGSIDQAHTPNEFIDVSQMDTCMAFLRQVMG